MPRKCGSLGFNYWLAPSKKQKATTEEIASCPNHRHKLPNGRRGPMVTSLISHHIPISRKKVIIIIFFSGVYGAKSVLEARRQSVKNICSLKSIQVVYYLFLKP